ncbi:hypothetical protein Hanom_Chr09g00783851 [Helianthus anomalus]
MDTSPHSNPEVAGSSLAPSQCPYGSGFTSRLSLAGWRSARWDHLGGWEDRGISLHTSKIQQLQRAFAELESHRAVTLGLKWKQIEDHFHGLEKSLKRRFTVLEDQEKEFETKTTQS